jgi:hypothetical protein
MDLLIYAVFLGLGLFFLLISVAVEHLFRDDGAGWLTAAALNDAAVEGPHPDAKPRPRLWSPTLIAAFVLGFGAVGVGLSQMEWASRVYLSVPVSWVGGVSFALVVQALCRRVFPVKPIETGCDPVRPGEERAMLLTAIPEGGQGEVLDTEAGVTRRVWARTENGVALAAGRTVRITRRMGGGCYVEEVD